MWHKLSIKLAYGGMFLVGSLAYDGCLRAVQDNIEGIFAPEAMGNEGLLFGGALARLLGMV